MDKVDHISLPELDEAKKEVEEDMELDLDDDEMIILKKYLSMGPILPRNVNEIDPDLNRIQNLLLEGHNQKLNVGADGTFQYLNDRAVEFRAKAPSDKSNTWTFPDQKLYSVAKDPTRKKYSPFAAPSPRKYTIYPPSMCKDDANRISISSSSSDGDLQAGAFEIVDESLKGAYDEESTGKALQLLPVDLVKEGGHTYFIRFLDSVEAYPERHAISAFVLTNLQGGSAPNDTQTEPPCLQRLCLCLGKSWEDFPEAQIIGLLEKAPIIFSLLLLDPQPEVRASAVFALGTLLNVGFDSSRDVRDDEYDDDEKVGAEINIVKSLLNVVSDGIFNKHML
ncbi:regulatory-associated protein of TOR 1 isoform X4 [Tanacetum coccineum]